MLHIITALPPNEFSRSIRRHTLISLLLAGTIASGLGFATWLFSRTFFEFHVTVPFVLLITLITGLILYRLFNRKTIRRIRELSKPFPPHWRSLLTAQVEYYRALGDTDKLRFEQRLRIFLLENTIVGVGWEADEQIRLLIAAGAVIPALGLREWEYHGLGTIFVYPDAFDADYRYGKGAPMAGQVTRNQSFRALAFSRAHVLRSFLLPADGRNVVIHEFVHLIDGVDGAIDGQLEISWTKAEREHWQQRVAIEQQRIATGRTLIDRYALASRIEFLAVLSEYFFELPDVLAAEHPEVFDALKKGFKQDPKLILSRSQRPARAAELMTLRDEYWLQADAASLGQPTFTDQLGQA
jgi:Mlc titration factor MtfA (ptsG expression regulator)